MEPLDSRTMSGKLIDAVIKELPYKCVKTNLCDADNFTQAERDINAGNVSWNTKYIPENDDIVVLLGRWVQENFFFPGVKTVKLPHPASIMGSPNKQEYINKAKARIYEKVRTIPR